MLGFRVMSMTARTRALIALAVAAYPFWGARIPAIYAQGLPGQSPTQQAGAAPPQVFGSDAALVLNFIKPDRAADFEAVLAKLKEALQKSERPERKQQAVGWRVFKAAEPGPAGTVIYLFVIDPALKGANYSVAALLAEAFPADAQALQQDFADTLAQGQTFLNLTLRSVLRK
jgi:hypothetical protein